MDKSDSTRSYPGWMRWVLVISLALNLLVVGMVGGWMLKVGKHGHYHPSRLDQVGGPLTRALSKEDRRHIGQAMRRAYRDRGEDRATHRAAMQALIAELRKDTFDRPAVETQLSAQRAVLTDRVALGQTLLTDRLEQMSAAERATFADRLEHNLTRRGKKRHRGENDD